MIQLDDRCHGCQTSSGLGQHTDISAYEHQYPEPETLPNTQLENAVTLDHEIFPEGGRKAWLSLLGCFCAWMSAFGLMNTTGTFQAYLGTHQLSQYSESEIGWIFGLYLFMAYCCGVQAGPIFDALGPRQLTAVGSICLVASMFLLEVCHRKSRRSDMSRLPPSISETPASRLTPGPKVITISLSSSPSLAALGLHCYRLWQSEQLVIGLMSAEALPLVWQVVLDHWVESSFP